MTLQLRQPVVSDRKMSYKEFLEWDGENQHVRMGRRGSIGNGANR
jgi:hypothetical protein